MKLNDEESDILAGKAGPVPQQALQHQIKVGEFFGAEDMVPVTQAHLMADTESLGEAGVRWLEGFAANVDGQRRVRIPTITDPRGTDFANADLLGQTSAMLDLERRAIAAFEKLGVAMTNTCINYQTIQAPTRNEHAAFGDTGVVIYSKSDQLKHFGASMASFGSIALYHLVGLTPEAGKLSDVAAADLPVHRVTRADAEALQRSYHTDDHVDVVVFSAPQLSLYELGDLAELCDGRRFTVPLLAVTSPQVKPDSDRMGYTARIEGAGGNVLSGMCFYQSYAREISEANGWKRLATNSAKLVNILGGYGYRPMLASMEACVDAAVSGKLERT